ncbi:MAG: radical SAM protein [Phycisphaerae bacterium]|jgi:wyosine [tRNA(Phe)-imidazoG37] synthetase (radical SAM superfamily)|nr:radical SAM protein [Phycisphaerae bacterium]
MVHRTEQNSKHDSNGLWLNKEGRRICYNPWTHFEVNNTNGDVTMCCDVDTVLGNVNEQSIESIWNSEEYQQIRKQMYNDGADKMCGSNCLLLNGTKNYQRFSWFRELDENSDLYKNALLNENEIREGKACLSSYPRWMRFAISYKCNYNCYHCCQEDDRQTNRKLPDSFIAEAKTYIDYYQFLFIFGGEPTLFREFPDLLKLAADNPHVRYGTVSNGSIIHRHFAEIEKVNWAIICISLDAATENTYERLRRSKQWKRVNQNLQVISEIKKRNNFEFTITMTVNSKNCNEIYDFVSLANHYNATPKMYLVSNPNKSFRFNHEYLSFNKKQTAEILEQIERVSKDFPDIYNQTGLSVLKDHFRQYNRMRQVGNDLELAVRKILPASFIKVIKNMKNSIRPPS